jgi:hypothetical protein
MLFPLYSASLLFSAALLSTCFRGALHLSQAVLTISPGFVAAFAYQLQYEKIFD